MYSVRSQVVVLALLLVEPLSLARGDGLFYQLPKDGSWALYSLRLRGAMSAGVDPVDLNGTLRIASVGRVVEAGLPCRWIESKIDVKIGSGNQGIHTCQLYKLLIPEKYLAFGQSPLDHVVRGWLQYEDYEPAETKSLDELGSDGWLEVVLSGPWKNVKRLNPVDIGSKLGTLSCEGVEGTLEVLNKKGVTTKWRLQSRMNGKSPFGVITSH